jgi:hypothetical protein
VAELFKIETEQTQLSWSRGSSDTTQISELPEGRLAVIRVNRSPLNIQILREGVPDEVASNLELEVGPRLYEETFYNLLLRGKANERVELRHRDPAILQALHFLNDGTIHHGSINFRSQIGRSRFSVYIDGQAEYDFEVEVFPSKLDYAADYDALVADVQDSLPGLVLEYLRSTFKSGFPTDSDNTSRLEWILLLRHVIDDLERGLRYIEKHPHHDLIGKRVATRLEKLRHTDATITKLVARGKDRGPESRLPERRSRMTWDVPENRWLASQLAHMRQTLAHIHSAERKHPTRNKLRHLSILKELIDLEERIAVLQSIEPIAQAKGLAPAGFTSLILQNKPGYREAYRACLVLLKGLRVEGGPVGLSMKEIHRLYEYWCYLALLRMLAKITGEPVPVRQLFSVEPDGLKLSLKRGVSHTVQFPTGDRLLELTYNPKYDGDAFVLPQQPDLVLSLHQPHWPIMRIVIDAKYRINYDPRYVKQFGSPGPPQDTIDALHRYRDAILEETGAEGPRSERYKRSVVEAAALFPYVDVHDEFHKSGFWTALERVGIGAIPFLPRETRYLEEWLRKILQQGGWSTAERTIPYPSLEQLRVWREAEKESVLVGVLRKKAQEHLEWIKSAHCYYTALTPTQRRQLISRWVAIYSPASTRSPGAVTHWARVENIETMKREAIDTPWLPQHNRDEEQVVYTLGELQQLPTPIQNRGPGGIGKRFSRNRWTSRLGILRAMELRELFLETTAEWRLYEQLRHSNIDFTLAPGSAKLQDEGNPRGRTWFVGKHHRVQYRGAAGFLIRRKGLPEQYRSDLEEVVNILSSQT